MSFKADEWLQNEKLDFMKYYKDVKVFFLEKDIDLSMVEREYIVR